MRLPRIHATIGPGGLHATCEVVLCGAGLLSIGFGVSMTAQYPADAGRGRAPGLLTEVRGLRQAMEQMAASGPRVQLALGRLQLQEQRVNTMIRRRDAARVHRERGEGGRDDTGAAGDDGKDVQDGWRAGGRQEPDAGDD